MNCALWGDFRFVAFVQPSRSFLLCIYPIDLLIHVKGTLYLFKIDSNIHLNNKAIRTDLDLVPGQCHIKRSRALMRSESHLRMVLVKIGERSSVIMVHFVFCFNHCSAFTHKYNVVLLPFYFYSTGKQYMNHRKN